MSIVCVASDLAASAMLVLALLLAIVLNVRPKTKEAIRARIFNPEFEAMK